MNEEVLLWKNKGQYFDFKGKEIFFYQQGTGEDLLILHGYPYGSYEWKPLLKTLSGNFRVTLLDFLGMGFSDKPDNHQYSYSEHCETVNELLIYLKVVNIRILAHDMGASVAQELLALQEEDKLHFKINSCAFINGGLFMDVYQPRIIQRLLSQSPSFIGRFLSKKMSKTAVDRSVKSVFGPHTQPSDEFLNNQWEVMNFKNGKSITYLIGKLVFEKYRFQERWINAMKSTNIDLCYICGPFDPNSGSHMAKRYEEVIPNPVVFLLEPHIGHWPFLEDPEGFLKLVDMFHGKR